MNAVDRRFFLGLFLSILAIQPGWAAEEPASGVTGTLVRHADLASSHVAARNIDVWLPPGYWNDDNRRFPVIYVHDGQNLFDPALAMGGIDWGIDEVMTRLVDGGAIRPAIVVGIWNAGLARYAEYMPLKAAPPGTIDFGVPGRPTLTREQLISDRYLEFLVHELKPFIDAQYRSLPGRQDTFVMGSSMGGLISAYAMAEYPHVFGGAACISTHWLAGQGIAVDYLGSNLPDAATHRIYFDFGTETLDAGYEPYQRRMDDHLRKAGYVEGENWVTRKFAGAEHNEASWRRRVAIPLKFLLD